MFHDQRSGPVTWLSCKRPNLTLNSRKRILTETAASQMATEAWQRSPFWKKWQNQLLW